MTQPLMNRTGINRTLTGREIEMLHWIMTGKSDWEIAAILSMSKKTVNYHVEKVKRKLGSPNRITAVALALRDGLISFPASVAIENLPPKWTPVRCGKCDRQRNLERLPGSNQVESDLAETERVSSTCQSPPAGAPDYDDDCDAERALPWAFASCHIVDDPSSGPCPALAPLAH